MIHRKPKSWFPRGAILIVASMVCSACSYGFFQASAPLDLVATTGVKGVSDFSFNGTTSDSLKSAALASSTGVTYVADRNGKASNALGVTAGTGPTTPYSGGAPTPSVSYNFASNSSLKSLPFSVSFWCELLATPSSGTTYSLQLTLKGTTVTTPYNSTVPSVQDTISVNFDDSTSGLESAGVWAQFQQSGSFFGNLYSRTYTGSQLAAKTWHNVIVTVDSLGRGRVYIDGTIAGETTVAAQPDAFVSLDISAVVSNPGTISTSGQTAPASGNIFAIDDLYLLTGALNDSQVKKIDQGSFTIP